VAIFDRTWYGRVLVEANDKNYARMKILRTRCQRLEAALHEESPSTGMLGGKSAKKSAKQDKMLRSESVKKSSKPKT
jgi:hypothetical protein